MRDPEVTRHNGESVADWEARLLKPVGSYHSGYGSKCLACGHTRWAPMRMHYHSKDRANSVQHTDECPVGAALKAEASR